MCDYAVPKDIFPELSSVDLALRIGKALHPYTYLGYQLSVYCCRSSAEFLVQGEHGNQIGWSPGSYHVYRLQCCVIETYVI